MRPETDDFCDHVIFKSASTTSSADGVTAVVDERLLPLEKLTITIQIPSTIVDHVSAGHLPLTTILSHPPHEHQSFSYRALYNRLFFGLLLPIFPSTLLCSRVSEGHGRKTLHRCTHGGGGVKVSEPPGKKSCVRRRYYEIERRGARETRRRGFTKY